MRGEDYMKKKIIIISILIIVVVVLLLIPKDVYKKIFKKDQQIENSVTEELVYETLFVKNDKNCLVGIKVGVKKLEEDEIAQKWDLLTKNVSSLPSGYTSPINVSAVLYSHVVENNSLVLNVSEDFIKSDGRSAVECLAWNYCNGEIKEVVVKIDDKKIDEVGDFYFRKIAKEMGTNFTYEAKDLFESSYLTVVYYENDTIKPVTYFFDDTKNLYDYVIAKMLKNDLELSELVNAKGYTYEVKDTELVINLSYGGSFNDEIKQTILETIKLNFKLSGLLINGSDAVMLKESFIGEKTE